MQTIQLPHEHGQIMEHNINEIPANQSFQTISDIFKLLSDSSRIRIFWLLCHGEECVINLSAMMEMSSPAVSHHLKALKAGNLITSERNGKEVYYKAADTEQGKLLHHMIENLMDITCPILSMQEKSCQKSKRLRPSQEALIKEIHDKLTKNLSQKYTIEELSKQYLINTSSLKADFKAVYGMPIAAYMKEYRIKQAMKLLLETKESISSIASMVGYSSQSKFTKAFKEITQSLPSEFRQQKH